VLVSGTVGLVKPDPAIYLLLIERHAVDVRHSMFIDDSTRNVEAAADLGFDAVHFRSPEQLGEELRRRGLIAPVDSRTAGGVEGDE
jgi:2-haloacid dehalogenase